MTYFEAVHAIATTRVAVILAGWPPGCFIWRHRPEGAVEDVCVWQDHDAATLPRAYADRLDYIAIPITIPARFFNRGLRPLI